MTLRSQFEQELTSAGTGGVTIISISDDPRTLICEIDERNSLAVAFQSLRLTTAELADASAADLERISKSLAGRLTYLMEAISPIEVDAAACTVQLRSNPPQQDEDSRSYYELIVRRGGELSLCRYRKDAGSARRQVATTVTREVLVRLVGDFCAALE